MPKSNFENNYCKLREIEGRIYADDLVLQLPFLPSKSRHFKEWKLRAKSADRFITYIKDKRFRHLLELGCGNGWFINRCAPHVEKATGIDVNEQELEQAKRVFQTENLSFYSWDVFSPKPFEKKIDCIVLNAVVQYFPDFKKLIERLKELLDEGGEIHLIDSPFYSSNQVEQAKQRSVDYFSKMGVPEMAEYYFHHKLDHLAGFDWMYKPIKNPLLKRLKAKDSPFPWLRLKVTG